MWVGAGFALVNYGIIPCKTEPLVGRESVDAWRDDLRQAQTRIPCEIRVRAQCARVCLFSFVRVHQGVCGVCAPVCTCVLV